MVGTALRRVLPDAVYVSSQDADLRCPYQTEELYSRLNPSRVIHLAARVGGVKANMENLGSFYYDNVMINTNVLEASRVAKVEKVLSLLSTCVYPAKAPYPLKEESVHAGPPHISNYGYAYAKRMLDVQSRAYRTQYGCDFITAIPNNLFGENDYFDLDNSHVIPAMIRKIYEAKNNNTDAVLWGDGQVYRQFTYAKDLALLLIQLLDGYNGDTPVNVGNTEEHLIKDVAEKIAEIFNFTNEIVWDTSMPKGQVKKPSDGEKLKSLGSTCYTSFHVGLFNTCKWFEENYNVMRGK